MKTNTPNPLVPQGTFDPRGKSHVRIAVFTILAIHMVLLSALLMAGCKKTAEPVTDNSTVTTPNLGDSKENFTAPAIVTTPPPVVATTAVAQTTQSNPTGANLGGTLPNPDSLVPPQAEREHTILKGDSFAKLAKKYSVSVPAITALNPNLDPKKLKIGDKVKIPPPGPTTATSAPKTTAVSDTGEKIHVVKSHETLISIAKAEGTSVKAIMSANGLKTSQIKVGAKLKIPVKAATTPIEPAPAAATGGPATVASPASTTMP